MTVLRLQIDVTNPPCPLVPSLLISVAVLPVFRSVRSLTFFIAIESPPFSVTETGWGEFEIQIKIHFVPEASEKPMTLFHFLHLHPYGPNKDEEKDKGLTVEAYQYEEIVHTLFPKFLFPYIRTTETMSFPSFPYRYSRNVVSSGLV